jgi:hypothetical protein
LLRNGHSLHVYEVTEICVVCARTGGLAEALARDTLDAELLLALAGLFGDLTWTTDRPDHDPHMNDYERGIEAARHLVRHLDMAEPEIRLWERVVLLRNALDPDLDLSWPLKEVDALRSGLDRFLARPEWPTVAERALETAMDPHTCSAAARAAEHFGIPMFDHAWRWLHEDYELGGWVRAMEEVTAERIDEVLEYALATFRLPDIPQEPTGELYYHGGKFYRALSDLNCVVGRLNRFPGKGWELIRIGLRTPGSRDREDAVRALEAWAPESLTDEQRAYLAWAAAGEPDVELRRRMQALADA